MIAGAVDFVVFIGKNRHLGGRRCVATVLEVSGAPDGRVSSNEIFMRSPVDGRATRVLDVSITEERRDELADAGYDDTATSFFYDGGQA